MLNLTANEESLRRVSRFFICSCVVVLAAGDFVYAKFHYRIQYNRFRVVLHAVDSLNVKHEP